MKTRTTFLTAVALGALTAGSARAGTRVGIEMGETLGGAGGLGARVDLGAVQLEGLFGGQLVGSIDAPRSVGGAVRVAVPVHRWQDGWIGVGGGLGGSSSDYYGGAWSWAIEGELHAEWFPLPALSLGLDVGIVGGGGSDGFVGLGEPRTAYTFANLGTASAKAGGTVTFWF